MLIVNQTVGGFIGAVVAMIAFYLAVAFLNASPLWIMEIAGWAPGARLIILTFGLFIMAIGVTYGLDAAEQYTKEKQEDAGS